MLTAEVPALNQSENESLSEEIDIKEEIERTEFALDFGGGVLFPAANITFFRYQYTFRLTKINREASDNVKNKEMYINLGALFECRNFDSSTLPNYLIFLGGQKNV